MKAIIIHGAYGHPEENWIPWLKKNLEADGLDVYVPKFPTPDRQDLDGWLDIFKEYEQHFGDDLILIGHSIGVAFLLNLLQRFGVKAKAAFLISGFTCELGNPAFDELNRTFVEKPFDWDMIKQNCENFYVFHSDNDPYVSLDKGNDVANNLGVDLIVVPGAGHFNESAGYTEFKLLLDKIKENQKENL